MAKYSYTAVVEQDEDGVYISSCPAVPGCHSNGETYEEAVKNLKEAIQLYIEARQSLGEPIPLEKESSGHGFSRAANSTNGERL